MTFQELVYNLQNFEKLTKIVNYHNITMESIVKIAEQLAIIGDYGKLDIYKRIIFDGAHSE